MNWNIRILAYLRENLRSAFTFFVKKEYMAITPLPLEYVL